MNKISKLVVLAAGVAILAGCAFDGPSYTTTTRTTRYYNPSSPNKYVYKTETYYNNPNYSTFNVRKNPGQPAGMGYQAPAQQPAAIGYQAPGTGEAVVTSRGPSNPPSSVGYQAPAEQPAAVGYQAPVEQPAGMGYQAPAQAAPAPAPQAGEATVVQQNPEDKDKKDGSSEAAVGYQVTN